MKTKIKLVILLALALTLPVALLWMAKAADASRNAPFPRPTGPCDIYATAGWGVSRCAVRPSPSAVTERCALTPGPAVDHVPAKAGSSGPRFIPWTASRASFRQTGQVKGF